MLPRLPIYTSRKLLNNIISVQKTTECQFSRLVCNSIKNPSRKDFLFHIDNSSKVCGFYLVRHESTVNTIVKESVASSSSSSSITSSVAAPNAPVSNTPVSSTPASTTSVSSTPVPNTASDSAVLQTQEVTTASTAVPAKDLLNEIPDPPVPIPEQIVEAIKLSANGEPTFESLGLGGWGPIGLIQWYFEWLHVATDMPWWAAIVLTSAFIKIVTFPLTLDVQRNNVKMQHILPKMVQLQAKLGEAKQAGNVEEASLYGYKLQSLLKDNKISIFPISNVLRIGVHIPVFMALRGMANTPVESLKQGGLYWFTDLTVADPYYILPACTAVSLFFVAEYAMMNANNMSPFVKYLIRGLPLISFIVGMNFPGVVLCHWVTANFITITQNELLRMEKVRKYFNIPPLMKHSEMAMSSIKQKSFKEAFSDSMENLKLSNKIAQHAQADMIQFNHAGKGLVQKTYKHNPKAMSAMKK